MKEYEETGHYSENPILYFFKGVLIFLLDFTHDYFAIVWYHQTTSEFKNKNQKKKKQRKNISCSFCSELGQDENSGWH